jgi:DNA-binding protein HU-beta
MNKGELVDAISKKAAEKGLSVNKKTADEVLSATLEVIIDTVAGGDKVTLVGFGSFEVPAFSAGKSFKEQVSPPSD